MALDSPPRPPQRRFNWRRPGSPLWFGLTLFAVLLVANIVSGVFHQGRSLNYSDFKSFLAQGRIVEVELSKDTVHGKYQDADGSQQAFTAVRVDDPNLAQQLDAQKVRYSGEVQNEWLTEL